MSALVGEADLSDPPRYCEEVRFLTRIGHRCPQTVRPAPEQADNVLEVIGAQYTATTTQPVV